MGNAAEIVAETAAVKFSPHRAQSASILERIGNTPLVRLGHVGREFPLVEFYAKAEWFNPGGSVKDRAALAMIRAGEESGALRPDKILLDATSGNTGIAYAMIASARGYRVQLCLPASASAERKGILQVYGAELVLTAAEEGSDGAIRRARSLNADHPDRFFYCDQYSNPANWRAHYWTTAPEIWSQTAGRITHFVAGLGTSGTFVGTVRRLKELNSGLVAVSVQPDSAFHGLEGLKHMATAIVPSIYDPGVADLALLVRTEDAYAMVRRLAREEGLLVGPSSGAALVAAFRAAERIPAGSRAVMVTVFPDSGERYLSERFWDEAA